MTWWKAPRFISEAVSNGYPIESFILFPPRIAPLHGHLTYAKFPWSIAVNILQLQWLLALCSPGLATALKDETWSTPIADDPYEIPPEPNHLNVDRPNIIMFMRRSATHSRVSVNVDFTARAAISDSNFP